MELQKIYTIKEGDTLPPIEIRALDHEGNPLDLSEFVSAEITIAKEVGGRPLVQGPAEIFDPAEGVIRYAWKPGETKAGKYLLEVILKDGTGGQMTLPGAGYSEVIITPRL